jgi:TRAP-type C4-dicarboxylate transport system permease small subunit
LATTCFAIVAGPLAVQTVHAADPFGLETTRAKTQFKSVKKTLPQAIGAILSVALSLIGFVFLGLALYAGFKWMTAQGDSKDVTTARDTLINAVIGIILIVAAYSLTNFIFTDVITKIN